MVWQPRCWPTSGVFEGFVSAQTWTNELEPSKFRDVSGPFKSALAALDSTIILLSGLPGGPLSRLCPPNTCLAILVIPSDCASSATYNGRFPGFDHILGLAWPCRHCPLFATSFLFLSSASTIPRMCVLSLTFSPCTKSTNCHQHPSML